MKRVAVPLALLALVAGCGGSQSTPEIKGALISIMVLPASEIGSAADTLRVDPDSGYQTTPDEAAESTLDPEDTGDDLRAAGWVIGYGLDYTNGDTAGNPVEVSSEVTIFRTPEQARAWLDDAIGGAESLEGTEIAPDARLTSVEVEEADGPGENAWRGTATVEFGGESYTSSVHAFTVGPAIGQVSTTHVTGDDPPVDLEQLAGKLDDRIRGVSEGSIKDTRVPIPTTTTTSTAPVQDPALERMVLSVDDLPAGVSVKEDGYVTKGGDVSFERDFAIGNATIGQSELIGLQSNAELMDSAGEAALAVRLVSGIVKGERGQRLFRESFAEGAGFDAKSLVVEELPAEGIGDEVTALHATFDTRAGPFEAVLVFIASGRAAGQIYAAAAKGRLLPEDILALARTMAEKMEAEQ